MVNSFLKRPTDCSGRHTFLPQPRFRDKEIDVDPVNNCFTLLTVCSGDIGTTTAERTGSQGSK